MIFDTPQIGIQGNDLFQVAGSSGGSMGAFNDSPCAVFCDGEYLIGRAYPFPNDLSELDVGIQNDVAVHNAWQDYFTGGRKKDNPEASATSRDVPIDRIPITSSYLDSVGYDADNNIMEVEFWDGSIYKYEIPNVAAKFRDLMAADSHGQWFYYNIRSEFPFWRVDKKFPLNPPHRE